MLSQDAINQFRNIWFKRYKQEIRYSEAEIIANRLIELMKAIYRPIPKTKHE